MRVTAKEVMSSAQECCGFDSRYIAYHAPRYAKILNAVSEMNLMKGSAVLDIGPSPLSELIQSRFPVRVDTLGFGEERIGGKSSHYSYDLNMTSDPAKWKKEMPRYDLIIFAEVLEHLYTSPRQVLAFLRAHLTRNGKLILMTPNAAALTSRIKLLAGRNPNDLISENLTDPSHFRVYTVNELMKYAAEGLFCIEKVETDWYFNAEAYAATPKARTAGLLKNVIYSVLPRSLRSGIMMVLKN